MTNFVDVSDFHGRIRFRHNNWITTGSKTKAGYMIASVRGKSYSIHRLVGFAHLRDQWVDPLLTIDHLDFNRSNNSKSNLEWITIAEQNRRRSIHKSTNLPTCSRRILVKRKRDEDWTTYNSLAELGRSTSLNPSIVARRLRGKCLGNYSDYDFKELPYQQDVLEGEKWKNVNKQDKETGWQVSDFGRVKNTYGIVSHGGKTACEYMTCSVGLIHHLVAFAFLPPQPSKKHTVDHINGDTTDNRKFNLEWITRSEQIRRQQTRLRQQLDRPPRSDSRVIESAIIGTNEWDQFVGIRATGRKLGIPYQNISHCLHGRAKTTAGRMFRFVDIKSQKPIDGETWVSLDLSIVKPDVDTPQLNDNAQTVFLADFH